MKLEILKAALKKYNNKKMPDVLQKEITANWNSLCLWIYCDYKWVEINLSTWKPYD